MVLKMQKRFLSDERALSLTQEWESTKLDLYIKDNPTLSKESLDKMITRLQELQICLPKDYSTDRIFKDKFLSACVGVDECRLARQKWNPLWKA